LALFLLVALLSAATLYFTSQQKTQDDYLLWKQKYNYQWPSEEDAYRRLIFLHNL